MVFCFNAARMPSGMPIDIATSNAIVPNWAEMGRLSRKMSLTVRLRDLNDGPKFIQRNQTGPTLIFIRKSSDNEVVGAIVVTCGMRTL